MSSSRSKHCMCTAHFPPYFQLVILDELCYSQQVIKAKLSIKVILYEIHQLKILKSVQGFENCIWAQCYNAINTYFLPKLCSCNKCFEIRWSHFRLHALSCIICNDDMKCTHSLPWLMNMFMPWLQDTFLPCSYDSVHDIVDVMSGARSPSLSKTSRYVMFWVWPLVSMRVCVLCLR